MCDVRRVTRPCSTRACAVGLEWSHEGREVGGGVGRCCGGCGDGSGDADDDDVLTSCVWVQVTDQTLQAKLSIMMLWVT